MQHSVSARQPSPRGAAKQPFVASERDCRECRTNATQRAIEIAFTSDVAARPRSQRAKAAWAVESIQTTSARWAISRRGTELGSAESTVRRAEFRVR